MGAPVTRSYELAESYRRQRDAEISRMLNCMGNILATGKVADAKRKAYWKASKKISAKIFPRGRNFTLFFEGSV
mgnify:CR=1 FL=1|jgi:hypothetical protein|uniref:Uncharacterized protein n=1 Tax=Myoviridae sp. ctshb19 TaxID=2825194 RepID=A0A8S5UGM6_9CAUD|nr:MAG TPA: hypothetical protein [Myoviridae sp. ctshb19]